MNDHIESIGLFLTSLFERSDIIEIRPIELWADCRTGKRKSRPLRRNRRWLAIDGILQQHEKLRWINEVNHANIFFGVNPRRAAGVGRKPDVRLCRSIWADMDDVTPEVARWRCKHSKLPQPSILVDSGSGAHLYWLLDAPVEFSDIRVVQRFEAALKRLYRRLGTDATSDVNRLLRLPGFWNTKNARNGDAGSQCVLVACDPQQRYSLDQVVGALPAAPIRRPVLRAEAHAIRKFHVVDVAAELDRPVADRSRRDFAVVCRLLRMGVARAQIEALVKNRSKFATNGQDYFDLTLANAMREIGRQVEK